MAPSQGVSAGVAELWQRAGIGETSTRLHKRPNRRDAPCLLEGLSWPTCALG